MGERKDKCKIPSEVATRLSWIDIAHAKHIPSVFEGPGSSTSFRRGLSLPSDRSQQAVCASNPWNQNSLIVLTHHQISIFNELST